MARVQIYTTPWCGYCRHAKALLQAKGLEFDEIDVERDPAFRQKLMDMTGRWTVPQIVIDGEPVGGFMELRELERRGELDRKLAA